jgi:putative ABC transport system permease protein
MENLRQDLRYVVRGLSRSPFFFVVTVLTLGLGIGATTAIFSVVDGVLLRSLPYPNADRIVQLWQVNAQGGTLQFSDPNFADLQAQSRSYAALAEFDEGSTVSVSGASEPVRAHASHVSRDFFRVLGVAPFAGRTFVPEELRPGAAPALVVSHRFWQQSLGGDRLALGKSLSIGERAYTVVGVMPPALDFPANVDLWMPRELDAPNPYRTGHNWRVIARLANGVTLERARTEATSIAKRLKQLYGDDDWMVDASIVPLREQMVGGVKDALWLLLAASGFLLLIACANVVNLLVARTAMRQGEIALRLALGAGRKRLAQQFVTEAFVLSLSGGALGVLASVAGAHALVALEPGNLPRLSEVSVNGQVLAFALAVCAITALALGAIGAWQSTRRDLRDALANAQRTHAGSGGYTLRSALVVAQMALTVVLLVGAGLLGRSFLRVLRVDPGYRTERMVVLDLSVPFPGDSFAARRVASLYDDLLGRLSALPGVTRVGGVNAFPLTGGQTSNGTFLVMSRVDEQIDFSRIEQIMKDPARTGEAEYRVASADYFRAMNIPLVRGRLFDDRDAPGAPHVALVSASLAQRKWPNEDAIGKIIQFGNMDGDLHPFTVIGVVGDVREASLAASPRPTLYAFYRQRPRAASSFNFVMQAQGDVAPLISAARRAVHDLRPDVPPRFRTIETVVAASIADRRFILVLIGVFGAAALVLASLGVYGVISYLVAQRQQELGIRVALGAQRIDVLRLVVGRGAALALIGIALGAAAAFALTRVLSNLLYGISATDPISFTAVIVLLVIVAMLASWMPARRAARIDPMRVLRES